MSTTSAKQKNKTKPWYRSGAPVTQPVAPICHADGVYPRHCALPPPTTEKKARDSVTRYYVFFFRRSSAPPRHRPQTPHPEWHPPRALIYTGTHYGERGIRGPRVAIVLPPFPLNAPGAKAKGWMSYMRVYRVNVYMCELAMCGFWYFRMRTDLRGGDAKYCHLCNDI